jgi:hypothetical protein
MCLAMLCDIPARCPPGVMIKCGDDVIVFDSGECDFSRPGSPSPPFPPRTKWTRRVPHPVLIGNAASLTPY